jgi:hypothetical protein
VEDDSAAISSKYTVPNFSYWPGVQGIGAMLSIRRTAS